MSTRPFSIAETIVHGVVFDPKNSSRVLDMDLNKLSASVRQLFDLLDEREVAYVLVGGIALLAYIEGRNTQDIDLILSRADLANLPELKIEDENQEFARAWLGDLKIDLLFTDNQLFQTVAEKFSTKTEFWEREIPCATESGLVALKLFALPSLYRQGQFDKVDIYERDITALLRQGRIETQPIFRALEGVLLSSDFDELKRIVAGIQQRIAEEQGRFSG